LTQATLAAAWLCVVCGLLFGGRDGGDFLEPERLSQRSLLGRIALAAVAYLLLYLVAGMLIYPKVQDWYELQGFEAGPWILPLALVRGACYALFSLWLVRSMRCTRMQCAFAIAVMFPILAGIAALVIPTGIMPSHVRAWHALEIGWSNFVFGFLVGWLFWRRIS
jgi:cytochrome bd-type quinol oxidase subunit 2